MTMLGVIVQATSEQTIGSTLQGTGVDSPAPTLFVQTD